jgi:hypothetical protein
MQRVSISRISISPISISRISISPISVSRMTAVAVISVSVMLAGCGGAGDATEDVLPVRPLEFSASAWDVALGGEGALDPSKLNGLTDLPDGESAMAVARDVVKADLDGVGRERFAEYFRYTPAAGCQNVTVSAASAFSLGSIEGVRFAKALVLWSGSCATASPGVRVANAYMKNESAGWVPVRHGEMPQSPERTGSSEVPQWALRDLACGEGLKARIEVAMAWEQMCKAASSEGVQLQAQSAWRSIEEQRTLFEKAVKYYGSESEARRYVADATKACESRHCAGEAIDVRADAAALGWLQAVVACRRIDGTTIQAKGCQQEERPITMAERYGFSQSVTTSPGHLEYSQVLNPLEAGACADTPSAQVPTLVVEVWRCTLRSSGVVTDQVLSEALVVSECASAWNPAAQEFDGRYSKTPNPTSGRTYEGVGLFGIPTQVVSGWVAGGAADDAWSNALAGARLYADSVQHGRDPWGWSACARGDAAVRGVLAEPFPTWVQRYVTQ